MSQAIRVLKKSIPQAIRETGEVRGQEVVLLAPEHLKEACLLLREQGYILLSDICGADYPDREKRFEVIYHLYSFTARHRIRLKIQLEEGESVDSVSEIWPMANWDERETYDMYGITFEGHPDLRRILNPECISGYPLRKDYPLEGEEFDLHEFVERKNAEIIDAQD